VVRSTSIAAPPSAVFERINDLRKFQEWSPWAKVDPNCKYTFEGPAAGQGAAFSWEGDAKVGAGKMTITESRLNELVRARLDFFKPFAGVGEAEYAFKNEGNKTVVSWTMTGKKVFITKAIGIFISMDRMLGGQFEAGLANLKAIVESGVPAAERR
jgi:carbon monoxide dehydrogenase subunit G